MLYNNYQPTQTFFALNSLTTARSRKRRAERTKRIMKYSKFDKHR